MEQELTYEAAYNELMQIAREIEDESVSVDVLAEKVKRGVGTDLVLPKEVEDRRSRRE
ncbi:MAG: exodeoxyribonuclease VII small subunit [Bacteroidota bacterium]